MPKLTELRKLLGWCLPGMPLLGPPSRDGEDATSIWYNDGDEVCIYLCDNLASDVDARDLAALLVAAVNALPALLDLAEAAAHLDAVEFGGYTYTDARWAEAADAVHAALARLEEER